MCVGYIMLGFQALILKFDWNLKISPNRTGRFSLSKPIDFRWTMLNFGRVHFPKLLNHLLSRGQLAENFGSFDSNGAGISCALCEFLGWNDHGPSIYFHPRNVHHPAMDLFYLYGDWQLIIPQSWTILQMIWETPVKKLRVCIAGTLNSGVPRGQVSKFQVLVKHVSFTSSLIHTFLWCVFEKTFGV